MFRNTQGKSGRHKEEGITAPIIRSTVSLTETDRMGTDLAKTSRSEIDRTGTDLAKTSRSGTDPAETSRSGTGLAETSRSGTDLAETSLKEIDRAENSRALGIGRAEIDRSETVRRRNAQMFGGMKKSRYAA